MATPPHLPNANFSFAERVSGGLIALVSGALTTFFLPWLLFWKYPIYLGILFGISRFYLMPIFYLWILIIALLSFQAGFTLGFYRVLDVFNILWRTGETYEPQLVEHAYRLRRNAIIFCLLTWFFLSLG